LGAAPSAAAALAAAVGRAVCRFEPTLREKTPGAGGVTVSEAGTGATSGPGFIYGRNPKEHDMNTLIKVAALSAVLSASAAFAQDYPATTPSSQSGAQSMDYTKLDKNGDGNISKDEAKADPSLSAKFDALDTDKSGSLSTTELTAKSKDK